MAKRLDVRGLRAAAISTVVAYHGRFRPIEAHLAEPPLRSQRRLGHVPALDGLRGVAVLLVVSYHAFHWPRGGYLGVDLFFVLSGFLITRLLLDEQDRTATISIGAFYGRRARRLLPALAVVLTTYVAVTALRGGDPFPETLTVVLYVANIIPWIHGTALGHLWSLATEEQFYLIWPLLLLALLRRNAQLIMPLLGVALVWASWERLLLLSSGAGYDRLHYWPDVRCDGLVIGCATAILDARGVDLTRLCRRLAASGAAPAAAAIVLGTDRIVLITYPLLCSYFAAWVYLATRDAGVSAILRQGWLVWFGGISYALYLWHVPILVALGPWRGNDTFGLEAVAVSASIAVAYCSTRFVERPLRRRLAHPASRPHHGAASGASCRDVDAAVG